MNTCWERADRFALLHVMFSCVLASFPYGVLGQVWYLIVWIPDLCILSNFLMVSLFVVIDIIIIAESFFCIISEVRKTC